MDDFDTAKRLQLDAIDEEYRLQFGVQVDWIKAQVGAGDHYKNIVAHAVLSQNGAWFECLDLPMEFSGVTGGPVDHQFVTDAEAMALLDRLFSETKKADQDHVRELRLIAIYQRGGIIDERAAFVYHSRKNANIDSTRPRQLGKYKPEAMPMMFRCKFDIDGGVSGLPFQRGTVFCLAQQGEKNLLVRISYDVQGTIELSQSPLNMAAN